MRTYEVLFILTPQVAEDEATSLISDFRSTAEKQGAKLMNEESWGRKRLAYPIEKQNDGIYHLFTFEAEGEALSELDRRMKNSDRVLRHLITRTDEDIKRATKLAKKNPKKERERKVAPAAAATPSAPVAPEAAAAATPAAPAAPEAPAAPAAPAEEGPAPAAE